MLSVHPCPHAGEIVVATTRVETMLGDTAVAVHPEDPRWVWFWLHCGSVLPARVTQWLVHSGWGSRGLFAG